MQNLSKIYNVIENLRGITSVGHCRPTIAEFFTSDKDYGYTWCSFRPLLDNFDEIIYDSNDNPVLVPGV